MKHLKRVVSVFAALVFSAQLSAAMVAGFENTEPWADTWTGVPYGIGFQAGPPLFSPVEGSYYLSSVTFSAAGYPLLSLASASFATGGNLSGGNILSLSYAAISNTAAALQLIFTLADGANNQVLYSAPLSPTAAPSGAGTDWRSFAVSMNYLRNLGFNAAAVTYFSIECDPGTIIPPPPHVSFDRLALDVGPTVSTPNFPASAPSPILACGNVVRLQLPALVQNGTNPPDGFHLYRAPASTGPWTSVGYITGSAGTWDDPAATGGTTYWYIAMPFDRVCPVLPGTTGKLLQSQADAGRAYLNYGGDGDSGPNEALISSFSPAQALQIAVPTPDPLAAPGGVTGTGCDLPQIYVQWNPVTLAGCSSVSFYRVAWINSLAVSAVTQINQNPPSGANVVFNDYAGNATVPALNISNGLAPNASYYFRIAAYDSIGRAGPYSSPFIIVTTSGSFCSTIPTMTPTPNVIPPTMTLTPVPTTTPVPGLAQVYPNPFRPDRGECFKVGNIPGGTKLTIYDMNGDLVYTTLFPISSSCPGGWDAFNNNGQKVVTGIYYLVVAPTGGAVTTYRVAVIRE